MKLIMSDIGPNYRQYAVFKAALSVLFDYVMHTVTQSVVEQVRCVFRNI